MGTRTLTWTDGEARAALGRYEDTVRRMARRLGPAAAMGHALDEDDLCAEGRVAVLEALSAYGGYGIEERTWVRTRIRQRMIDAIRRLDLRTRDEMRLAVRHASGATHGTTEHEKGRVVAARRLVSLDRSAPVEPLVARMPDRTTTPVEQQAHAHQQGERLARALSILPPRQRRAIELGLFSGLALREIGDQMGISESRVCQLQKRAVHNLNRAVRDSVQPEMAA